MNYTNEYLLQMIAKLYLMNLELLEENGELSEELKGRNNDAK